MKKLASSPAGKSPLFGNSRKWVKFDKTTKSGSHATRKLRANPFTWSQGKKCTANGLSSQKSKKNAQPPQARYNLEKYYMLSFKDLCHHNIE